jgi:hypothetical protein
MRTLGEFCMNYKDFKRQMQPMGTFNEMVQRRRAWQMQRGPSSTVAAATWQFCPVSHGVYLVRRCTKVLFEVLIL